MIDRRWTLLVFSTLLLSVRIHELPEEPARLVSEGPTGRLRFTVREKGGEPVPSRLTFTSTGGEVLFDRTDAAPTELAVRKNVVYTRSGAGLLELAPGTYTVYASRGLEWSLAEAELVVHEGGETEWTAELVHEVAWLIALVLILSVTNLDTLVMLPWILPKRKCGKQHDFLGFPSKGIMFVTLLSVVFENIPQLTVTYLNAERHFVDEGKAIPTVVFTSMVTSGGMILYNVVRKVLTGCLGAALLRDDGGADGGHKITAVVPAAPVGKLGVAAATAAAAAAVVVN